MIQAVAVVLGCIKLALLWLGLELLVPAWRRSRLVALASAAFVPAAMHVDALVSPEPLAAFFVAVAVVPAGPCSGAAPGIRAVWRCSPASLGPGRDVGVVVGCGRTDRGRVRLVCRVQHRRYGRRFFPVFLASTFADYYNHFFVPDRDGPPAFMVHEKPMPLAVLWPVGGDLPPLGPARPARSAGVRHRVSARLARGVKGAYLPFAAPVLHATPGLGSGGSPAAPVAGRPAAPAALGAVAFYTLWCRPH